MVQGLCTDVTLVDFVRMVALVRATFGATKMKCNIHPSAPIVAAPSTSSAGSTNDGDAMEVEVCCTQCNSHS